MKLTVYVALYGWPLLCLLMFACWKPRRALLGSLILGWLFLPVVTLKFSGLPEFTKTTATSLGALLGILVFDFRRLISFRPRWGDLPMAAWCLCPMVSSLANELGLHDALSALYYQIGQWVLPYVFGRLY